MGEMAGLYTVDHLSNCQSLVFGPRAHPRKRWLAQRFRGNEEPCRVILLDPLVVDLVQVSLIFAGMEAKRCSRTNNLKLLNIDTVPFGMGSGFLMTKRRPPRPRRGRFISDRPRNQLTIRRNGLRFPRNSHESNIPLLARALDQSRVIRLPGCAASLTSPAELDRLAATARMLSDCLGSAVPRHIGRILPAGPHPVLKVIIVYFSPWLDHEGFLFAWRDVSKAQEPSLRLSCADHGIVTQAKFARSFLSNTLASGEGAFFRNRSAGTLP